MTTSAATSIVESLDRAESPAGVCRVGDQVMIILGEVITCPVCLAYLGGFIRASAGGFCSNCGVHLLTMKKQQVERAKLERRYELQGGA